MNSAHAPAVARPAGRPHRDDHRARPDLAWVLEHRAQILASIAVGPRSSSVACCTRSARGARGDAVWRAAVALLAAELAVEVGRTIVVEHSLGVDTIALVAMVGALALGEELAGVVIGLMFSGGAALEAIASRRARRELTALVQRAPKVAQLRVGDRLRGGAGRTGADRRRRRRADRRGRPGRRDGRSAPRR